MTLPTFAKALLASALVVGHACATPQAEPPPSAFVLALDSIIPAMLPRTSASGVAIAVVENGRLVTTKGYGVADKQTGRVMTDTTRIAVASVSKLVSSWGVMSLVAGGRLALDRPVDQLVTSWRTPPSSFDAGGITVRRLLSHTAGLSMLSVPCFPADSARPSEVDVLNGAAGDRGKAELIMAPGSGWRYSGGGYTLLQLAVNAVDNPFTDLMHRVLFLPLDMQHTSFVNGTSDAVGYDDGGNPVRPIHCVGEAAASLVTTARDMGLLLLEYGKARRGESTILPGRWIDTMATPLAKAELTVDGQTINLGDSRMGLGHFLHTTRDGRRILFHSGGNPGAGAYVLVDLDRDNAFFLALNNDSARELMQAVLVAWGATHGTDAPTFF